MENLIRKILREIFTEVIKTNHYRQRAEVGGRLTDSKHSSFVKEPESIQNVVYRNLDYLQDIEFPKDISVGVLVFRGKNSYSYRNPGSESFGKNIWVVVRGNEMTTLMFSNADTSIGSDKKHKTRTNYQINLAKLKDYIDKEKGGDKNLTSEDIKIIFGPEVVEPTEKDGNIVVLGGVKYVIDRDSEKIFKKNNPSQSFELLDFVSELNPNDQEKIYSLLEADEF